MKFHLTKKSNNRKTGPIPTSTSSVETCPDSCPWKSSGCYADGGPLKIHWNKVSKGERGVTFNEFLKQIDKLPEGQLWRHNQAGDLVPLENNRDTIDDHVLCRLVQANRGKKGFTYTHYNVEGDDCVAFHNRSWIRYANFEGFVTNLSADSPAHADKLLELKVGPVTTLLPQDVKGKKLKSPAGNRIIVCPAFYNEKITCSVCKLCAEPQRNYIIGFPAHGMRSKQVSERIKSGKTYNSIKPR